MLHSRRRLNRSVGLAIVSTVVTRALIVASCMLAASAHADDGALVSSPPPPERPSAAVPPWLLPGAGLRLDTTAEIDVSHGKVGKPLALAPDAWFGASDDVTLGITESKYAATGFRGGAGNAFCISGATGGCAKLYNNVGVEAWGALLRGPLAIVAGGGPYATNLASGFYSVKVGFKARLRSGPVSLTTMPSAFVAATDRGTMNPDVLYVPAAVAVKIARATIGIGSGVKGPVSGFASKWQVPLGVSAAIAAGPIGIGASFTYGSLFGGQPNPAAPAPPVIGSDLRVVQAWVSYSWAPPRRKPAVIIARRVEAAASRPPLVAIAEEPHAEIEPEQVRVELAAAAPARITADVVDGVAHDHAGDIKACIGSYDRGGQVAIAFEVDARGAVARAAVASTVLDVALSDCVLHALRGWAFPAPDSAASGIYTLSLD